MPKSKKLVHPCPPDLMDEAINEMLRDAKKYRISGWIVTQMPRKVIRRFAQSAWNAFSPYFYNDPLTK